MCQSDTRPQKDFLGQEQARKASTSTPAVLAGEPDMDFELFDFRCVPIQLMCPKFSTIEGIAFRFQNAHGGNAFGRYSRSLDRQDPRDIHIEPADLK
jgi:hypothetical protein